MHHFHRRSSLPCKKKIVWLYLLSLVLKYHYFEVSLLVSRGKLELPLPVSEWLTEALANSGVESLPVTCEIANRAVTLSEIHRDPADRIIIATALVHDARLASFDSVFPNYQELENRLIGK